MLHFITGFQGSGKSLYAERIAETFGERVTYVGTLPCQSAYEETLEEHRARRPPHWNLLELIGDGETDLDALRKAVAHSDAVLIDGISFYLFRMLCLGVDLSNLLPRVRPLLVEMRTDPCLVLIVDSPIPQDLPDPARRILRYAHALLAHAASTVTFFSEGQGRRVGRRSVLEIDRGTAPPDWRFETLST